MEFVNSRRAVHHLKSRKEFLKQESLYISDLASRNVEPRGGLPRLWEDGDIQKGKARVS